MTTISLSATTTARCIDEMTSDVRLKLMDELNLVLSLELDECRDMSKGAELLAFVCLWTEDEKGCNLLSPKNCVHFCAY